MSLVFVPDAASGVLLSVEATQVVSVVELGQLNQSGYSPACQVVLSTGDDVLVRGTLAAVVALLGAVPPVGGISATGTHFPVFDMLGGPAVFTLDNAVPWRWLSVYDPNTLEQTLTMTGSASLAPNSVGAIPFHFSLPIAPASPFVYPELLAGRVIPDAVFVTVQGYGTQPDGAVQAVVADVQGSGLLFSLDGKPQQVFFTMTWKAS